MKRLSDKILKSVTSNKVGLFVRRTSLVFSHDKRGLKNVIGLFFCCVSCGPQPCSGPWEPLLTPVISILS
jgi:hypothetical protein